ncbi:TetR/AcrR family transcriptional regulator [Streptomyces fructofermentans]|uniref:TetR family transcriptional regulator n=1 Tax=Streptomyces fructofermentans TaxID=152141 RepID=A0A918KGA1_9ACTN|nr:TetR/AcrR family transcriptional regulator [Streptomyces fructofermentans]GGX62593.1 TetR family transcriptional regulator [Streptomyces fructofermentans]
MEESEEASSRGDGEASSRSARTPRERYRLQVRAEVKEHAREQIAAAGASALSLNAIARQMGMSGPALYRYFSSRDELITELVRDAYRSLADTFVRTAGQEPDPTALAHALREWALQDPHRYFLVYGTPVPGYRAPDDVTVIATEIMAVLLDAWTARPVPGTGTALDAHLQEHRRWAGGHPAPAAVLRRALAFWTRLHGVLSLELAGHFNGMGLDPALLYASEVDEILGRGSTGPDRTSEG